MLDFLELKISLKNCLNMGLRLSKALEYLCTAKANLINHFSCYNF